MAAGPRTIEESLKLGSSDLRFTLSRNDVQDGMQALFFEQGSDRAQVASIICSWKDTQTKAKRQSELEAEMNTREWSKPIPTGDYVQLRNSYSQIHGVLDDKDCEGRGGPRCFDTHI